MRLQSFLTGSLIIFLKFIEKLNIIIANFLESDLLTFL